MQQVINLIWTIRIWHDTAGQDLIEYALMSGLIATGVIALSPQLANSISMQFSKVATPLSSAALQGS
ncbi:MAG TPA: Flp family type IVb pilin [Bryobacteraceae bacterium]|jgi:Flp pilus assembly pilin Flp